MRAVPAILALQCVFAAAASAGHAQTAAPPVITCTSLANLRMVLRSVKGDAAAAIPVIADPKSDLGCSVLDRAAVTGIADHIALNGQAYDCLALQNTAVCHWTVAGSVRTTPGKAPVPETGRH